MFFAILPMTTQNTNWMELGESVNALFDHASEGIIIANKRGEILKANPSAEKLFGYHSEELIGQMIEILIPDKFSSKHIQHRENYNKNPHARSMGIGMDLSGKRKDNTEFPVEISLSHYSSAQNTYVIAFIIDITLRKQAETKLRNYSLELEKQVEKRTMVLREAINELENTKAELNVALAQEKELNDLKSRFVSMASHEFRTPLSTILSSVALIGKYNSNDQEDKRAKHINRIKSSVNNLTDILNDFLSLSRLEEGKINSDPVVFDINELGDEVLQEMKLMTKTGQHIICLSVCKSKEVYSDRKLLKNILINLISNAIKFSPENRNIYLSCENNSSKIIISVKDEGIGIPLEDQHYLFQRFFRANNATNIQGTGLGLNIVARYVDLLNGKIEFTSEMNKGTLFTLTLPKLEFPKK